MAKFIPRGKLFVELALLTYKREDYIENEGKRPVTSILEKRKQKTMRRLYIEDSDEEGSPYSVQNNQENSNFECINNVEELNLPTPIPNLPSVQPEASSTPVYANEKIREYGEWSDGDNNDNNNVYDEVLQNVDVYVQGEEVSLYSVASHNEMDVDTSESNVNIGLSSTYSISREEEKEKVNKEVPEVIVPVVVSELTMRVGWMIQWHIGTRQQEFEETEARVKRYSPTSRCSLLQKRMFHSN